MVASYLGRKTARLSLSLAVAHTFAPVPVLFSIMPCQLTAEPKEYASHFEPFG